MVFWSFDCAQIDNSFTLAFSFFSFFFISFHFIATLGFRNANSLAVADVSTPTLGFVMVARNNASDAVCDVSIDQVEFRVHFGVQVTVASLVPAKVETNEANSTVQIKGMGFVNASTEFGIVPKVMFGDGKFLISIRAYIYIYIYIYIIELF